MKVLFIADLDTKSASGFQRLWALEQCSAKVISLNKKAYKSILGGFAGLFSKVLKRPHLLINNRRFFKDLITLCLQEGPEIIWMEWPRELRKGQLQQIKSVCPNSTLISFQDDNPWGHRKKDAWIWRNYFENIPSFDIHITKRFKDIKELARMGAKDHYLWMHGIYPPFFYPSETKKKYPVTFTGTCMDKRAALIEFLLNSGIPIYVFGNSWHKRSDLPRRFPNNFHKEVEGENYAEIIRESQICLGLVSSSNEDEWTMRSFEVPACGVPLLAQRTNMHETLFEEGKEIVLFSSNEECRIKLQDLLNDSEKCKLIGNNAYKKCVNKNYSLDFQMKAFLRTLSDE